jgi:hypothetical protein
MVGKRIVGLVREIVGILVDIMVVGMFTVMIITTSPDLIEPDYWFVY